MHKFLKKLLKKTGSILLVSVLFMSILFVGSTSLILVAQVHLDKQNDCDALYSRYTYQSLSSIMVQELITDLAESSVSMYYTPLLTVEEIEIKLQENLFRTYVNKVGTWIYDSLIPQEVTSVKYTQDVTLYNFNVTLDPDIDFFRGASSKCEPFILQIRFNDFTAEVLLDNLFVEYKTKGNRIVCRFDVSNVLTHTNYLYEGVYD